MLLQAGLALGTAAADSLFLVNVGADKLPHIYLLTPVVMMFYIPAYSFLQGRWGIERVFDLTLAILVVGGLGLWLVFRAHASAEPILFCYGAKLYSALWVVGIYTLLWNFIDNYFDLLDAKRLFALFAAGSASGAIIGGSLVGIVSESFGVAPLFLGWSLVAALAWPLTLAIRRGNRPLESEHEEEGGGDDSLTDAVKGIGRMLESRYTVVLTLLLFGTLVTATICEYQYMGIFSAGLEEAELAGLFGRLNAIVNVLNLALTLFIFNKLITRLSVQHVALIQPITYSLVFVWLLLDRGFLAAVGGFIAYQGIMTAIDYNNVNLLFSGLPSATRKQTRTLIEGIGEPLATATAGVFLFLAGARLSPAQLSMWGIVAALVCLGLVFILRSDFPAAIAANLRRDSLDFTRSHHDILHTTDPAEQEAALEPAHSEDPEVAALAVRFLLINDPPRAADCLMGMLTHASFAHRRHARPLFDQVMTDRTSPAAQEVQRWIERHPDIDDGELVGHLGRHALLAAHQTDALFASDHPRLRAAAAVTLWQSSRIPDNARAINEVEQLLQSGDQEQIALGIEILGLFREPKYAFRLRDFLRDPNRDVRNAALQSICSLVGSTGHAFLPDLISIIDQGTPEQRQIALDGIERINDSQVIPDLLARSSIFLPAERRRVERLILGFGPRTVPLLSGIAQSSRYAVGARCLALRVIGRHSFAQVESLSRPLIDNTIARAYQFLGKHHALSQQSTQNPGLAVLARSYRDVPSLAVEIMLEALTIAGRLSGHEAPLLALRGGQSKERGYAIEAVEQACSRDLFALLLPLIDGRPIEGQIAFGQSRGLFGEFTVEQLVFDALDSQFPLESAAALQALFEADSQAHHDKLLAKLRQPESRLARPTLETLLARQLGLRDDPTPIELVAEMMQAGPLRDALFLHHETLVSEVRHLTFDAATRLGAAGQSCDGFWYILAGGLQIDDGRPPRTRGTTVAFEHYCHQTPLDHDIVALAGTRLLHLPASALRRCVEIHPPFGLVLLKEKFSLA